MALNTYDVAKHHVGLRPSGGATNYGFMLVGAYDREMQREAPGPVEFGGNTDLVGQAASLSRLTQDDFTGGAFGLTWGKDDAMFVDCTNMIPSVSDRSLYTCPPLVARKLIDVSDDAVYGGIGLSEDTRRNPVSMFVGGAGAVYTVFPHVIIKYLPDTDTFIFDDPGLDGAGLLYYVDAAYDHNEQQFWSLVDKTDAAYNAPPELTRWKSDLTAATPAFFAAPAASDDVHPWGFGVSDQNLVVGIGLRLYTFEPPEVMTAGATGTWTKIGRLPGRWVDSMTYNGMTYILCGGLDGKTHLVAFDGVAILPVCSFGFNFRGLCLAEYAGRVYVGGIGTDLDGSEQYGELYEVTGATVRVLRGFSQRPGLPNGPTAIRDMVVAEGLLWMGEKNHGSFDGKLWAYDVTTDGFFGASEFFEAGEVRSMAVSKQSVYAWIKHATDPAQDGLYRIARSGDTVPSHIGSLTTSDFAHEPSLKKRWSQLVVMTRNGGVTADYSTDSGQTFTALSASAVTSGLYRITTFDLSAITASEAIRFRFSFDRGTDATESTELVAWTMAFAFLENGKRAWHFVVNGSDEIEGRDDTAITQDVGDYASNLWTWARDKTALVFTDIDGTTANVQIVGFKEHQPIIGPNITGEARPEAHYAVSLLEV